MMHFYIRLALAMVIATGTTCIALAQQTQTKDVPRTISYQGRLTDTKGSSLPDGSYELTIRLYSDAEETMVVWQDRFFTTVEGSVFNALLGSGATPLPEQRVMCQPLWLGVQLAGDDEMRPLTALSSAPYALGIADNSVSTQKLEDNAVTSSKMGTDYVSGIAVNGVPVTAKGTVLNIKAGDNALIQFDSNAASITFSAIGALSPQARTLSVGSGGTPRTMNAVTDDAGGGGTATHFFPYWLNTGDVLHSTSNTYDDGSDFRVYEQTGTSSNSGNTWKFQVDEATGNTDAQGYISANGTFQDNTNGGSRDGYFQLGNDVILHNYGAENLFVGEGAGNMNANNLGEGNTGVGYNTLSTLDGNVSPYGTGSYNTAVGALSMQGEESGKHNAAAGYRSLSSNTTGSYNAAFGSNAGFGIVAGSSNSAIGYNALSSCVNAGLNTAVGSGAMENNTASENVAIGYQSMHTNIDGTHNTAVGNEALYLNSPSGHEADANTAVGYSAMRQNRTGQYNTATGYEALYGDATGTANSGNNNSAFGSEALKGISTGSYNTAMGASALGSISNSGYNTAVGYQALSAATTDGNTAVGALALGAGGGAGSTAVGAYALAVSEGGQNTAMGYQALGNSYVGDQNTAIGYETLNKNIYGYANTALGYYALYTNGDGLSSSTDAHDNTGIGTVALEKNETGNFNTAVGSTTMFRNTSGTSNTAMGAGALFTNETADSNAAFGASALHYNTGTGNTAVGYIALQNVTSGYDNTAIGNGADIPYPGTLNNTTAIGNKAIATTNNSVQLGNEVVTKVTTAGSLVSGMPTSTPNPPGAIVLNDGNSAHNSGAGWQSAVTVSTLQTQNISYTLPAAQGPSSSTSFLANDGTGQMSWTTVSPGGVTNVTASTPLYSSGGAAPNISISGTLDVAHGGSGVTSVAGVLHGNGASPFSASNVDLAGEVSGVLPVPNGGSGTSTLSGVVHGNGAGPFSAGAVDLATEVTNSLSVGNGGTGSTSLGGVLHGNGTSAITGSTVDLSSEVAGTLPVAKGGSGASSLTGVLHGNGTSAFTAGAVDVSTDVTGILQIANGGTGATTGASALTNLGGVALSANNSFTGSNTFATATLFGTPLVAGSIVVEDGNGNATTIGATNQGGSNILYTLPAAQGASGNTTYLTNDGAGN
jgi:hypothetical protein